MWNRPSPQLVLGEFTLCCNSNIPLMPHSTVLYHSIPLLRTPMFQCTSSRFSNFLVAQWQCLPCKVWVNLFFKKRFPWQVGDKLEEKALTSPKNYIWKYLFLSLILLLRGFKGRFMFSFHLDPDLDILLEKLTAQIVARTTLGTQL